MAMISMIITVFLLFISLCVKFYVSKYSLGFQIPASPVMEGIVNFHHDLFFFLLAICCFVFYMLGRCIFLYNNKSQSKPIIVVHAPILEIIWTLIPALILIFVAIPSFSLLYSMDEVIEPLLTIKVIGHQWYWSYEFLNPNILFDLYLNENNIEDVSSLDVVYNFDSYLVPEDDLKDQNTRLLDVDNRLYLPIETNVRILLTAADVLHCWAIPALGVKLDACPGRLNQTSLFISRPGIFFGQCSEICGVNHGFMPIAVVGLDLLGDGSKLNSNVIESIIPIYTSLLGKYYNKE
jgi:cytochrome c oxidase subunit 2